jgi:hypothetical protein
LFSEFQPEIKALLEEFNNPNSDQMRRVRAGLSEVLSLFVLPKDSEASVVFFSINGARGFDMVKKLTKSGNHTVGNPAVHRLKRHPRHLGLLFTIKK